MKELQDYAYERKNVAMKSWSKRLSKIETMLGKNAIRMGKFMVDQSISTDLSQT